MSTQLRGVKILDHAALNKGSGFSLEEREQLGLRGLLPPAVTDQPQQVTRVLNNLRRKAYDIERYIFLLGLQNRNEKLFYRSVIDHIEELMPIIYTPTVGQACKEFSSIFRDTRGFYITAQDRGSISSMLDNWPHSDVKVIVVTDGERILGLGDLGANGMGIPIGKLSLYTACAGIRPEQCMPVLIDVGTNNQSLHNDPMYLGTRQSRISGTAYFELMDEFMEAVHNKFPQALVQFEDFLTPNAYSLLNRYESDYLCFNDDIQGTAAVVLAGIHASTRITGHDFKDLRIVFLGKGSAASGIGQLVTSALVSEGRTHDEAHNQLWFVDRQGLLTQDRSDLDPRYRPYLKPGPNLSFTEVIHKVRPHILIGATGTPETFTREHIQNMAQYQTNPVIFALSNPTSRAECTAEQAYEWSQGSAIFASGSPFAPISQADGSMWRPGQGNNAYIFPGIGLGAVGINANRVTEAMFLRAAKTLSKCVSQTSLDEKTLYPPLTQIRDVSLSIATEVAAQAQVDGHASLDLSKDQIREHLRTQMYNPIY